MGKGNYDEYVRIPGRRAILAPVSANVRVSGAMRLDRVLIPVAPPKTLYLKPSGHWAW